MSYAPTYGPDFANGALTAEGSYAAVVYGPKASKDQEFGVRQVRGVDGIIREQTFLTYEGDIEGGVIAATWPYIAAAIRDTGSAYHGTLADATRFYLGGPNFATEATNTIINRMTLRWQGGDNPVEVTLGLLSRTPNHDAAPTTQVAMVSAMRYLRRHLDLSIADAAYIRSFDLSVDNKCKLVATGEPPVEGEEQYYDRYEVGIAEVRFSIESETPPAFTAASPSDSLAGTMDFDNGETGGAYTATLSGLSMSKRPVEVRELREGRKVYKTEFDCLPDSVAIASTA